MHIAKLFHEPQARTLAGAGENCKYGIYTTRMNVNSSLNNMTNMTIAYHIVGNTQKFTVIEDNKMQTTQTSVELLLNDGANQTIVQRNHITFGTTAVAPQAVGILAAELKGPNPHSRIHNNEIFFAAGATNAYAGIHANATTNYQITENTIVLDDNNKNQYGIFTSSCVDHTVSCNNIQGAGIYPIKDQAAICTFMGSNPTIGCNNMDHTENGILVLSSYVDNASINTNSFNDHTYGLHYGPFGDTPLQDWHGNTWTHNTPQNNGKHAYNDKPLFPPVPFYRFNGNIITLAEPLLQEPINWFQPSSLNPDAVCKNANPFWDSCAQFGTTPPPFNPVVAKSIIDSNIVNGAYTDQTQW